MASESAIPEALAKMFTEAEIAAFKRHFSAVDTDNSGTIDENEVLAMFKASVCAVCVCPRCHPGASVTCPSPLTHVSFGAFLLHSSPRVYHRRVAPPPWGWSAQDLGEDVSMEEIRSFIAAHSSTSAGELHFPDFVALIADHRSGSESALGKAVAKHATITTVKGATGHHSYAEEEKVAFTEHINHCLGGDEYLAGAGAVPMNPSSMDLFANVADGILLCKLINAAVPDTVDERALNFPKKRALNPWEVKENQNLCINAAKAIGCTVVNVHANDLVNCLTDHKEYLALGIIWQIVKIQLLSAISLKEHPELVRLLNDGEELPDLLRLPPEEILLRWLNFHLREGGSDRTVKNFGGDLKDGEVFVRVLNHIFPSLCSVDSLAGSATERATAALEAAKAADISSFLRPSDITSGNAKLNLAFCAQIFNKNPGLEVVTEAEMEDLGVAELIEDDDPSASREERVFRMWINSLNIEDVYVNNLFEDLRDGVVLLRVIDKVETGVVDWSKVNLKKLHIKFKKIENCNYAVTLGKQDRLHFSLVGIGGVDIHDANKLLVLAFVWQLMRHHIVKMLAALSSGGGTVKDSQIIAWANGEMERAGKDARISNFRDKSLSSGRYLLELLASIEPRVVDWDVVTAGESDADKELNAKYVLSVARKIGAAVFLTWEDIVEVKDKMIMTLVASLQLLKELHGSEHK